MRIAVKFDFYPTVTSLRKIIDLVENFLSLLGCKNIVTNIDTDTDDY